jgi:methionyl aminopeptidase
MVVSTKADVTGLQRANQVTARLLRELMQMAQPGVRTRELNEYACAEISRLGADPVFHTEAGFPGCINTSVNDVVLHGVPSDQTLKDGDVLSIDVGMLLDGYVGDTTATVAVGTVAPTKQRLIDATRGAMQAGVRAAVTGKRVGDISHAMQQFAETHGYNVMRGFHGHGVGHTMHEEPSVPFNGRPGTGPLLEEGLVITIEPALVEHSPRWQFDNDGWSVRTLDGGWGAQFEHTIIVTRRGGVILSTP